MNMMDEPTLWILDCVRELRDRLAIFSGGWEHELCEHLEVVLARIERREPKLTPKCRHAEWVADQSLPDGERQETA